MCKFWPHAFPRLSLLDVGTFILLATVKWDFDLTGTSSGGAGVFGVHHDFICKSYFSSLIMWTTAVSFSRSAHTCDTRKLSMRAYIILLVEMICDLRYQRPCNSQSAAKTNFQRRDPIKYHDHIELPCKGILGCIGSAPCDLRYLGSPY